MILFKRFLENLRNTTSRVAELVTPCGASAAPAVQEDQRHEKEFILVFTHLRVDFEVNIMIFINKRKEIHK